MQRCIEGLYVAVTVQTGRTVTAYAKSLRDGHMPAKFTFSYGLRSKCADLFELLYVATFVNLKLNLSAFNMRIFMLNLK